MNCLPGRPNPFQIKFIAVAASLTLCLLVAAALASSELRGVFLYSYPGQPVPGDATPYLGLTYVPLSHELAARYGVDAGAGVLVTDAEDGGPAARAGLRRGDILLSVDAASLTATSSLVELLMDKRPGDRVSFQILRDGKTQTVEMVLGAWSQG